MPLLSEWLQLMLGEIARKREELERARAEEERRELENATEDCDAARARREQSMPADQELAESEKAAPVEERAAARTARR